MVLACKRYPYFILTTRFQLVRPRPELPVIWQSSSGSSLGSFAVTVIPSPLRRATPEVIVNGHEPLRPRTRVSAGLRTWLQRPCRGVRRPKVAENVKPTRRSSRRTNHTSTCRRPQHVNSTTGNKYRSPVPCGRGILVK